MKKVAVSMGIEVEMAGEVMTYSNDPAKFKEKRKGREAQAQREAVGAGASGAALGNGSRAFFAS